MTEVYIRRGDLALIRVRNIIHISFMGNGSFCNNKNRVSNKINFSSIIIKSTVMINNN